MFHSVLSRSCAVAMAIASLFSVVPDEASAQARREAARTNVDRGSQASRSNVDRTQQVNRAQVNQNVNRNAQVNQNVNVNRSVNVDVDDHRDYHPFAAAAAVTAGVAVTSAIVGSITHSLPPSCQPVAVNGITYQQCGSSWYQPQYAGSQVNYVVVNPPQ
jgi:hypothetical protein